MRNALLRLIPLPLFALCAGLSSCSAEGAVSLTGSLGNVSLTVEDEMLVTKLSGGFDVYLELGERASGASNVGFSAFSLVRADTGAPVLAQERLSVVASKDTPLRIQPGGSTSIRFEIGDEDASGAVVPMEVDKEDYATVCGAGLLQIVGTMTDSAEGEKPTTLSSGAFTPDGC